MTTLQKIGTKAYKSHQEQVIQLLRALQNNIERFFSKKRKSSDLSNILENVKDIVDLQAFPPLLEYLENPTTDISSLYRTVVRLADGIQSVCEAPVVIDNKVEEFLQHAQSMGWLKDLPKSHKHTNDSFSDAIVYLESMMSPFDEVYNKLLKDGLVRCSVIINKVSVSDRILTSWTRLNENFSACVVFTSYVVMFPFICVVADTSSEAQKILYDKNIDVAVVGAKRAIRGLSVFPAVKYDKYSYHYITEWGILAK